MFYLIDILLDSLRGNSKYVFNISFLDQAKGIHRKTYQRISNIVSQRPQEIGQLAVNTLLENIQKGNQYVPIQSFIDCDLINIKE